MTDKGISVDPEPGTTYARPETTHLDVSMAHSHEHSAHDHSHAHGATDPVLLTSQRGIWAVKWSLVVLLATAVAQSLLAIFSGSVALMADTIHNVGDALTAVPLWVAFALTRCRPTERFTYGYGRVEDMAGVVIVVTIFASAAVVAYEAVTRFFDPQPVHYLPAVALGAVIGALANEGVARLRIKVGREIHSEALVADGHHARADALTSLAVLAGVAGLWLGYPLADPVVGLLIALVIVRIALTSGKAVLMRVLDAVDPAIVEEVKDAARRTSGVEELTEVRVRGVGHRLHAELNLAVDADLSIERGHDIALAVRHELLHHLDYLSGATVHVDPVTASGEIHHKIENHVHDELPSHSH